jgi:alanine dehydrogenase
VTHDGPPIELTWLGGPDVEELALADDEIVDAVEKGLRAQGLGQTTIEPRVHLEPDPALRGHFNVLRGYVAPLELAGVKIVGDYLDNYTRGLPSELGLLCLFDPATGAPRAVIDAAGLTDMRTGAVTAIGARCLARPDSKVLGHIGARGTAYWNVRLIDGLFELDEIRVHSRRPESRAAFAEQLRRDVRAPVVVTDDWESCVRGADIVVEASRLERPEPLLRTAWIEPGALVVPYGTKSAVELSLLEIADKVVVDDWGQCATGKLGSLRAHVDAGLLTRETLHAELGEIVAGARPGRERPDETIVLWHRGLSLSDIALGHAMLEKAQRLGIGQTLRYR